MKPCTKCGQLVAEGVGPHACPALQETRAREDALVEALCEECPTCGNWHDRSEFCGVCFHLVAGKMVARGLAPTDPTAKPTNPKDAIGSDKIPVHLVSPIFISVTALGKLDGALKYGKDNYRAVGVRASIYIDALLRHILAYRDGEDIDPDSGLPHFSHMGATLDILVDAWANDVLTDDRAYANRYRAKLDELTPHVKRLKALHAGKTPKHYTIADAGERVTEHLTAGAIADGVGRCASYVHDDSHGLIRCLLRDGHRGDHEWQRDEG